MESLYNNLNFLLLFLVYSINKIINSFVEFGFKKKIQIHFFSVYIFDIFIRISTGIMKIFFYRLSTNLSSGQQFILSKLVEQRCPAHWPNHLEFSIIFNELCLNKCFFLSESLTEDKIPPLYYIQRAEKMSNANLATVRGFTRFGMSEFDMTICTQINVFLSACITV